MPGKIASSSANISLRPAVWNKLAIYLCTSPQFLCISSWISSSWIHSLSSILNGIPLFFIHQSLIQGKDVTEAMSNIQGHYQGLVAYARRFEARVALAILVLPTPPLPANIIMRIFFLLYYSLFKNDFNHTAQRLKVWNLKAEIGWENMYQWAYISRLKMLTLLHLLHCYIS